VYHRRSHHEPEKNEHYEEAAASDHTIQPVSGFLERHLSMNDLRGGAEDERGLRGHIQKVGSETLNVAEVGLGLDLTENRFLLMNPSSGALSCLSGYLTDTPGGSFRVNPRAAAAGLAGRLTYV